MKSYTVCPACDTRLACVKGRIGDLAKCPSCGNEFVVKMAIDSPVPVTVPEIEPDTPPPQSFMARHVSHNGFMLTCCLLLFVVIIGLAMTIHNLRDAMKQQETVEAVVEAPVVIVEPENKAAIMSEEERRERKVYDYSVWGHKVMSNSPAQCVFMPYEETFFITEGDMIEIYMVVDEPNHFGAVQRHTHRSTFRWNEVKDTFDFVSLVLPTRGGTPLSEFGVEALR